MKAPTYTCGLTFRAAMGLFVAVGISIAAAAKCSAQALTPDETKQLMADKADVARIVKSGDLSGEYGVAFTRYFTLFFRQFTIQKTDPPPGISNLHQARDELRRFLLVGKSGAAYNQLRDKALTTMRTVVAGSGYHPAARVNAMLVLGSLNDREPDGKPLLDAFVPLLAVVKLDRNRFPDELKTAAMVGLERWAQAEAVLTDKQRSDLSETMLALLEQESPPAGRTTEGHNWMRRSAAKVLAALGNPGPDNRVVTAYEKILSDPQARLALRCEMAECLGQLKFPQGAKVDYQSLANLLGHQTVEICQRELDDARSGNRDPSRRLLAYALFTSLHGLEGSDGRSGLVAAATGSDAQQFVKTVRDKVEEAYKQAEDEDAVLDTAVAPLISELQGMLSPKPAPKTEMATEKEKQPAEPAKQPEAARAATGGSSAGGK